MVELHTLSELRLNILMEGCSRRCNIDEITSVSGVGDDGQGGLFKKSVYGKKEFKDYKKSKVVEVKDKYGYKIVEEEFNNTSLRSTYTLDDKYIGNEGIARNLCEKRGLKLELADPNHHVCSIGKCVDETNENFGKWYGYSHRCIWGFGVGDKVEEGDVIHGVFENGFVAENEDDCKRMAIAFAKSVS